MLKVACIPAYDEEKTIVDVVKKTSSYVDKILVYDDGSSDKTALLAEQAGAYVIRNDKNMGKGFALRSLFEHAKKLKADVVVTMDGDGQFLPEEIPKLLQPITENKSDIVIGYRFDNSSEMPYYRKIGNKVLDKMTNMASELPFRDTQSGFRSYSRRAIELIDFKTDGFGADSEILIDASKKGLRITEEKITVLYNTGSKTSTKHPVSHSAGVIVSLIELVSMKRPLRYMGIPGFILIIIGIVYSVAVISIFNETRYFSIPSTLIALGSLIIGVLLLLMSVVLHSIMKAVQRYD